MEIPRQLDFPKRLVTESMEDEVPDLAAALAYRFLFAIFPFAIFLAALAGFGAQLAGLQDPSGQIVGSLSDNLPPDIAAQLRPQLDAVLGNTRPGLLSIGAILALWAAMGGIGALMKAMNRAYDVEDDRGFVPKTLRAALLTVFGALGILVAFVTIVGGSLLTEQAVTTLGIPQDAWTAVSLLRFPVVLVLVAVAVAILFRFGPNVAISFRYCLAGGFAFAALWLVATVAFGLYVANFANYSNTYGALGGVVVLMLWFYLTALLLLVAAELTALLAKDREPHKIEARRTEIANAGGTAARKVGNAAGAAVGTAQAATNAGDDRASDRHVADKPPAKGTRTVPARQPARDPGYVASSSSTRVIALLVVAAGAVTGLIAGLLARNDDHGASAA